MPDVLKVGQKRNKVGVNGMKQPMVINSTVVIKALVGDLVGYLCSTHGILWCSTDKFFKWYPHIVKPEPPKDLTDEEVSHAIRGKHLVYIWDDGASRAHRKTLWGYFPADNLKYRTRNMTAWQHASYVKPDLSE